MAAFFCYCLTCFILIQCYLCTRPLSPEQWMPPVCSGSLPEFTLPRYIQDERIRRFPQPLLLQEICGFTIANGFFTPWGPSLGFFCATRRWEEDSPSGLPAEVVRTRMLFMRNEPGFYMGRLSNPRLELFCRLRCICPYTGARIKSTLVSLPITNEMEYGLALDDSYNPDVVPNSRGLTFPVVQSVERYVGFNGYDIDNTDLRETTVGLHSRHEIVCEDEHPYIFTYWEDVSFSWSWIDITSNTELCANIWNGGSEIASAGGVCVARENSRQLEFFDEFVPNAEFRLQENWHIAGGVRAYCQRTCSCAPSARTSELGRETSGSQFGDRPRQASIDGGGVSMIFQMDDVTGEASGDIITVPLIPQPDPNSRQCRQDGKIYCGKEWPEHIFGPKPWNQEADLISFTEKPKTLPKTRHELYRTDPTCGAQCSRRSDCTGAGYVDGCECRARRLPGIASAAAYISFCWVVKSVSRHGSGVLNPRGKEEFKGCACNQTYISESCCGSDTGLVWESPNLRLGSLIA